jgi:hypothetical protein
VNTPTRHTAVALLAAIFFSWPGQSVFARVGETQDAIERRILQPNVGKLFFRAKDKEKDKSPREAERIERERLKEESEQPFYEAKQFFPTDTREVVYWKSALGNQLSNENGWKVHVFYMGGRSSLEAYRRVGEALNEFEVRALLAVNRGASSWRKMSNEGNGTNGIGYDFELEDGSMRAKQKGEWLMIFSTRLDTYVVEQQKAAKELGDRETERLKREQQGKAPESVTGF